MTDTFTERPSACPACGADIRPTDSLVDQSVAVYDCLLFLIKKSPDPSAPWRMIHPCLKSYAAAIELRIARDNLLTDNSRLLLRVGLLAGLLGEARHVLSLAVWSSQDINRAQRYVEMQAEIVAALAGTAGGDGLENFFDAVRNDPDMPAAHKARWLAWEPRQGES